jgi:hypothetical protein
MKRNKWNEAPPAAPARPPKPTNPKLTEAMVRGIRTLFAGGWSNAQIVKKFKDDPKLPTISWPCVKDITSGKSWPHVTISKKKAAAA